MISRVFPAFTGGFHIRDHDALYVHKREISFMTSKQTVSPGGIEYHIKGEIMKSLSQNLEIKMFWDKFKKGNIAKGERNIPASEWRNKERHKKNGSLVHTTSSLVVNNVKNIGKTIVERIFVYPFFQIGTRKKKISMSQTKILNRIEKKPKNLYGIFISESVSGRSVLPTNTRESHWESAAWVIVDSDPVDRRGGSGARRTFIKAIRATTYSTDGIPWHNSTEGNVWRETLSRNFICAVG